MVLAAHGYPLTPRKGDVITGLPKEADDAVVFHAATVLDGDRLLTSGGRVMCVTVLADSVKTARARAHDLIQGIHFDGMQWRQDIGHRAIRG